ncbi:MAG: exodeoxyribonuclease V subunit gamma [Desulfobacterales bacterium]|jgi:exodeoxyribonuclease V gamma subunit|nr:exodeoxyribonuclease V subunit gamma [Desulfobacterales bacterium]
MLLVYQSNQMERLVDGLAEVLSAPLPSPHMPEWVGVQTQGLGVWLGLEVSRRTGIWANVYQPYPRALIENIFHAVMGESCPDTSLFEPNVLTWSIMDLLPKLLRRPEFGTLSYYLADDSHGIKQFQLARRIADTFDRYAVYRPDMVLAWETPGGTASVTPEDSWQPVLWRALVEQHGRVHVAAVTKLFFKLIQDGTGRLKDLPHRISLFGISTLPPLYLKVLSALPDEIPVHLFLLNPSREYWAYVQSKKEMLREWSRAGAGEALVDEALYMEEGHALLSSLGKSGRDFQCILEESADYVSPAEELYEDPERAGQPNLLHTIQSDILNLRLRRIGAVPPLAMPSDDESIRIHSCHGPMREVQVLQDQLLNIFHQDPTISPGDVVVMVPDITEYAPFIEAVFSTSAPSENLIPYAISDRGRAEESPVAQAFLQLLGLARTRLQVRDVLDLLALEPVRRRFALSVEELETARKWIAETGIRWGQNAAHRAAFGQPAVHQNTWRFGLDRLLLGIAMPAQSAPLFGGVLPYTEIEGKETECLGKVVDFCETLFPILTGLLENRTAAGWREFLLEMLSSIVMNDDETAREHLMIRELLSTLAQTALTGGFEAPFGLNVIHQMLVEAFKQRPSVHGFLSGGVTFCNLLPMRSIPFKVVCLLGMNDGAYPRNRQPAGFDLTGVTPRKGDRSVRNDDRYLFLEALLSARNRFLIFFVGQAIRDNTPMPPSVVVDELLDCIEEGFYLELSAAAEMNRTLRDHLVIRHPLQPFDPAYFQAGQTERFSYSEAHLKGAMALAGPKRNLSPFFCVPLSEPDAFSDSVHLMDLERFFKLPVAFLLQARLGIVFQGPPEEIDDREPMSLMGVRRHLIGEDLLAGWVAGREMADMLPVIHGQGVLPPGTPGECLRDDLLSQVQPVAAAVREALTETPLAPLSVSLSINGVQLVGEMENLYPSARICCTFGAVTERRKMALWISHLILNCTTQAGIPKKSILIGRNKQGAERYELAPIPEKAPSLLLDLLRLYRLGHRVALPFFPVVAYCYASSFKRADPANAPSAAMAAARKRWRGGRFSPEAEGDSPVVLKVFGDADPLGFDPKQPEWSFPELAMRVCGPLVDAELSLNGGDS